MSFREVASDVDAGACEWQLRSPDFADDGYLHNDDAGQEGRIDNSCAAKAFTTHAALEIADLAMRNCGGRGTRRDGFTFTNGSSFPAEKSFRDAKSYKIADGDNSILIQVGAARSRPVAQR